MENIPQSTVATTIFHLADFYQFINKLLYIYMENNFQMAEHAPLPCYKGPHSPDLDRIWSASPLSLVIASL